MRRKQQTESTITGGTILPASDTNERCLLQGSAEMCGKCICDEPIPVDHVTYQISYPA